MLDEGAPHSVVIGMRERPPVDQRGRHHREMHAVAFQPGELGKDPTLVAQREVRDGVHLAPPIGRDGRAPAIPRGHVREQARHVVAQVPLPQQPVVGEADRLVEAAVIEVLQPRLDEVDLLLGRGDARGRLLLEGMHDPDGIAELDGIDDPVGVGAVGQGDFHHA